jgi:hypothetical protein
MACLLLLATGCKDLRRINLSYCSNVTNRGLLDLAQGCLSLAQLDLRECSLVTTGLVVRLLAAGFYVRR